MYQIFFYVGLSGTVIFLLLSIIIFVQNDVAKLIGDVSGQNARKTIKQLNKNGVERMSKKETSRLNASKLPVHTEVGSPTDVLGTGEITDVLNQDRETNILIQDQKTDILFQNDTTDIFEVEEDTIVVHTDVTIGRE